ncbi:UBP-type zinc finger domain-containing protein (plasmid) [Deinococcus sp. KNUC1210]|uniref:UBP-type zinc finger domain-containing protein n=1 Tax=Deinococcus sp. KNUC1210 TaxID=2917691 RepID=UPI001EF076B6|nr:UBP-type zinc finger domain-containing protein [Deinococcus sp. KNUC1210]ULH17032.1 UBP-type zinc finger domain-containing protein [Deinococcus sp. KNUC1210]
MPTCTHTASLLISAPPGTGPYVCEDCIRTGDTWVHLRMCSTCGHIGCCDSSKNRHATRHFQSSQHPLMRSVEPGESWVWCYIDQIVVT